MQTCRLSSAVEMSTFSRRLGSRPADQAKKEDVAASRRLSRQPGFGWMSELTEAGVAPVQGETVSDVLSRHNQEVVRSSRFNVSETHQLFTLQGKGEKHRSGCESLNASRDESRS